MPEVTISGRGATDLAALSRQLRDAGERGKGLRKELLKSIRVAAKGTVADVKANASILPQRGGLAAKFRRGVGVRTTGSGARVGVRIIGKNGYDVEGINRGVVRHPVFGSKGNWVEQRVTPGWFTDPIEKNENELRSAVLDAMSTIAKRVQG